MEKAHNPYDRLFRETLSKLNDGNLKSCEKLIESELKGAEFIGQNELQELYDFLKNYVEEKKQRLKTCLLVIGILLFSPNNASLYRSKSSGKNHFPERNTGKLFIL